MIRKSNLPYILRSIYKSFSIVHFITEMLKGVFDQRPLW